MSKDCQLELLFKHSEENVRFITALGEALAASYVMNGGSGLTESTLYLFGIEIEAKALELRDLLEKIQKAQGD